MAFDRSDGNDSSALDVAKTVARTLHPGQLFMDISSVAPATKQAAAEAIDAAGGRYIDAAVMAPVPQASADADAAWRP